MQASQGLLSQLDRRVHPELGHRYHATLKPAILATRSLRHNEIPPLVSPLDAEVISVNRVFALTD